MRPLFAIGAATAEVGAMELIDAMIGWIRGWQEFAVHGLLAAPLLALVLALAFTRAAPIITVGASLANLVLAVAVALDAFRLAKVEAVWFGRIVWAADGLSVLMALTTACIALCVAPYAIGYWQKGETPRSRFFWPLFLLLLFALNGIFLSSDILTVAALSETLGLAAIAMVLLSSGAEARQAARAYYFLRAPAGLCYLVGAGILYFEHGELTFEGLGAVDQVGLQSTSACALMIVGLLAKGAAFPLHFWLPPAHGAAMAPAGALLSAIVVKAPLYLALRLWFTVFGEVGTMAAAQLIGALGAAGIIWGAAQALRQKQLKQLIAYSTVSQLGYLLLLFPLLVGLPPGPSLALAWTGGAYQFMAHALAKAAMLLAAGVVLKRLGDDNLNTMNGGAGRLPVTTFTLALAGVTLIGLPPSGGFVAKWLLLHAAIESGQWWWVLALVGGGLLTASYVFLMLGYAFRRGKPDVSIRSAPIGMEIAALILALAAALSGLRVEEPMQMLSTLQAPPPEEALQP